MDRLFLGYDAWKRQSHLLNKMDLRDLNRAYVTYPGVQIYAGVILACAIALGVVILPAPSMETALRLVLAGVAAVLVYPLAWYVIHRFVLHGRFLYKNPVTAALWKRIHFDHHRNPNDLSVLFGGLHTTIPTIVVVTGPIGYLIGGAPGVLASTIGAIAMTCFYEYCHCVQHLAYEPKWSFLRRIKKLHMAHHFHNENGNYGITNFFWDRLMKTHYEEATQLPRSATVRNLGYDGEEARRYPWVAQVTERLNAAQADTAKTDARDATKA